MKVFLNRPTPLHPPAMRVFSLYAAVGLRKSKSRRPHFHHLVSLYCCCGAAKHLLDLNLPTYRTITHSRQTNTPNRSWSSLCSLLRERIQRDIGSGMRWLPPVPRAMNEEMSSSFEDADELTILLDRMCKDGRYVYYVLSRH